MNTPIHLLLVSGKPCGWTRDKQWAKEWSHQLDGRSTVEVDEIAINVRVSINDPRLNWKEKPPLITIEGQEYHLLSTYVANSSLQIVKEGEKTHTPICQINHALDPEILDFIFTQMEMFKWHLNLNLKRDGMTIFSSLADVEKGKLAYIEERKASSKGHFFPGVMSREIPNFPYNTKFLQTPRFNLIDGLWHPAEDGEYEDVFCCMEMVPIACSIRFKSLLPA